MPEPTPAPSADLEHRIRADLAELVASGPDPASRRIERDPRLAEHRGPFMGRRHFLVGAAAATAVGGAGLTWRLARSHDGSAPQDVSAGPTTSVGTPDDPGWGRIAAAPLSLRRAPAVVWAGDRLIVCGGSIESRLDVSLPPDGASWTPDGDRWTVITPAPAGALPRGFAVWNGTEVLVGATEAGLLAPCNPRVGEEEARYGIVAYDPATDAWRDVAPIEPDRGRWSDTSRQAVWAGGRLLVAVRNALPRPATHEGEVVLVDVTSGERQGVDPGPFARSPYPDGSGDVALTTVGDLVVAIPNWDLRPWVLDVDTGAWRQAAPPVGSGALHLLPATAIGDRAACFDSSAASLWLFDPSDDGAGAWQPAAPNPIPRARWSYDPVWSGGELFLPGAAYDPSADRWRPVDPPPRGDDRQRSMQACWTGEALLLFGGEEYTCPDNADCDRSPGPDSLDGWLLTQP